MRLLLATAAVTLAGMPTLTACSTRSEGRQTAHQPDSERTSTRVDTGQVAPSTAALPVSLPVSESTPVGIRIDTVTIWLDSTPIGAAARALGPRSALGRYDPGESLLVACYRIAKPGDSTYVLLKAGISDTGRVVHVLIARTPDTVDPGLRCASLPTSSARVSNSLGLHLGMTWNDVEGLLGKSSDTTNGKFARYAAYVLARIPDDTSDAGERRAQHAHVLVTLEFRGDTLDMIRIRRGKPVPGSATE